MGGTGFTPIDSLRGIYALVVGRVRERRSLVAGILQYCGALVSPADSPDAMLAIMALLKPDIVVVDFARPEDDGLAVIRRIRALAPEAGGLVPTVAVGEDSGNAALARSLGFDTYLATP